MAFVVDGNDWKFDGKATAQIQAAIEQFLGILGDAKNAGVPVWFGEDFQVDPVLGDQIIWDLMSSDSPLPLPTEVWQELTVYLAQPLHYVDEERQPPDFPTYVDIAIDVGPTVLNRDVAWAHHSVRDGRAVACIGLWREGVLDTSSAVATQRLHWLSNPSSVVEFWREGIDIEGNSPRAFERLATRAYPELHFVGNVLHQAGNFVGGYYANAPNLKRHLAVLNDYGHWAFTAAPPAQDPADSPGNAGDHPSDQLVQIRFSRKQIDIAPEHANVKSNKSCRVAREVTLNGKVLYCEWHCKLEGHQNRIHVHRPVTESNDKLVVAIFADHLPLPGV
ncbi:hypothetical protein Q9R35_04330 [Alcaligenes sp. AB3]|uniref:hypothetical protein n=1 Tax=Alcaligenes sp. AB3 TaxID=2962569 RepID=UPI0028827246|nr:hypothetical protein [Alcaligenes sp. AB3]MDT0216542.1 hypothetical protein [Alcaligenes sp. AB3]